MLIQQIQKPPVERVGVLDVDSFFPASDRFQLAMMLNNLLASPGFSVWTEGEPLEVSRLLNTADGRPRLSIMSVAHLSESERMFFVTMLLNEVVSWVRSQPGSQSLRAVLYMDEIFGYFPPTANPPSKRPMLTLLKQARAHGVGVVLATQNPVDLDYKGLSNAGTWFVGRLQTERDVNRVIDGLEGASTGGAFDRKGNRAASRRIDQSRLSDEQRARRRPGAVSDPLGALRILPGRSRVSTSNVSRPSASLPRRRLAPWHPRRTQRLQRRRRRARRRARRRRQTSPSDSSRWRTRRLTMSGSSIDLCLLPRPRFIM